MRGAPATLAITLVVSTLMIPLATGAAATGPVGSLQATIDTSNLEPPSPDPMGITWWASKGRLLVTDSEVEEVINGITHYQDVNTWEISPAGAVLGTSDTTSFSVEPTDVAANGSMVYVSDDNLDRVFEIDIGPDGLLGTADDTRTSFKTNPFNSYDPEGVAYANSMVFVSDGVNSQIYRVDPGANGQFGGTDDRITCIDTRVLGMRDPEGVTVDPSTGNFYIASRLDREIAVTDPSGGLVDLINLRGLLDYAGVSPINPSGVTVGPASDDPSRMDVYVTDRAVDNNVDPNENDGKIYEIKLSPPAGNEPPVISSFGLQSSVEGEAIQLQMVAADPNGDPLSYSATGLPPGLSINPNTGLILGTIDAGASSASPYTVTVHVNDGTVTSNRNIGWTVTVGSPADNPPVITPTADQSSTAGDAVNVQIVANDPDPAQALMHSATGLPTGLWLDCTTGVIQGTIAPAAASGSPYTVRVKVEDQTVPDDANFHGKWDTETFTWNVDPIGGGGGGGGLGGVPPASPTGLGVTPESVGLALDWADNTETDLAGYEVGRADGSGGWIKLDDQLLTTSAYVDRTAPPGVRSTYRVTAIDTVGNESNPAEITATRPTVAFRGASAAAVRTSMKLAISDPDGVAPGDVLVAGIDVRGRSRVRAPLGWELVRSDRKLALRQLVYFHVVEAGDASVWRWRLSRSVSASAVIAAYSGVDPTNPVEGAAGRARRRSTSIVAPSLSTSASPALLIGTFGIGTRASVEPPDGMLEQADVRATRGSGPVTELSDDVLTSVGPTGRRLATASKPGVCIGQVLVLRPAP